MEKVSELILKGKLRLCQLAGIDPAEIIVPFNNDEIDKLWEESEPVYEFVVIFWARLTITIPNSFTISKRIQLIKRTNWILFCIVWDTPITGAPTFYADTNK